MNVFVAVAQERERWVERRTSPFQVAESESIAFIMVGEAGESLWRPLADVGGGAEGEPRLGHALEAAERTVGHPRKDLDERTRAPSGTFGMGCCSCSRFSSEATGGTSGSGGVEWGGASSSRRTVAGGWLCTVMPFSPSPSPSPSPPGGIASSPARGSVPQGSRFDGRDAGRRRSTGRLGLGAGNGAAAGLEWDCFASRISV